MDHHRSQFDILIHWWSRLWWWYVDAVIVVSRLYVDEPHWNRAFYATAPVLITDSLYWNVFSCWTEYIQWQKVAGPAWPVHVYWSQNRQLLLQSVKAPTVPNHCLLHIPPTEPCPGLDWQLPNICLTQIALLLFLNLASSNAEGFVDFKQATPVGGREVNVWRPNAARRSNLGFSSPGEWWKPHFNKLGFPVINPGMKGSDQGWCVGLPPPQPHLLNSKL